MCKTPYFHPFQQSWMYIGFSPFSSFHYNPFIWNICFIHSCIISIMKMCIDTPEPWFRCCGEPAISLMRIVLYYYIQSLLIISIVLCVGSIVVVIGYLSLGLYTGRIIEYIHPNIKETHLETKLLPPFIYLISILY